MLAKVNISLALPQMQEGILPNTLIKSSEVVKYDLFEFNFSMKPLQNKQKKVDFQSLQTAYYLLHHFCQVLESLSHLYRLLFQLRMAYQETV